MRVVVVVVVDDGDRNAYLAVIKQCVAVAIALCRMAALQAELNLLHEQQSTQQVKVAQAEEEAAAAMCEYSRLLPYYFLIRLRSSFCSWRRVWPLWHNLRSQIIRCHNRVVYTGRRAVSPSCC